MAASSKGTVLGAVVGNAFLFVIKLAAFLVSGSGAMLSEAIHSFADTANQTLLFIGIQRSERPADARYPYGYGAERYLFALLSAAGIFVLGCGVSIYHGVRNLIEPHHLDLVPIVFVVLGISLLVEGGIFVVALRSVWAQKGDTPLFTFLGKATDPTAIAVLLEDFVACLGVVIAASGIWLSHLTGSPTWDAVASILIGLMLGGVAVWLAWSNRRLILGPAVQPEIIEDILEYLESQPSIRRVERYRTRVLGAHEFRLSTDVEFDPEWLGREEAGPAREGAPAPDAEPNAWARYTSMLAGRMLERMGAEIDRIEAELILRHPDLAHIDLETD